MQTPAPHGVAGTCATAIHDEPPDETTSSASYELFVLYAPRHVNPVPGAPFVPGSPLSPLSPLSPFVPRSPLSPFGPCAFQVMGVSADEQSEEDSTTRNSPFNCL